MAIGLQNLDRISDPDGDFPNGNIKDNTATDPGTPMNKKTFGDIFQYFAKMMREGSITPNELPDSEYIGNQYYEALLAVMKKENTTFFKNSSLTVFSSENLSGSSAVGNFVKKNNIINGTIQVSGVAASTGPVIWVLTLPVGFVMKPTKVGEDSDHSMSGIIIGRGTSISDINSVSVIRNGVDTIDASVNIDNRIEAYIGSDAAPTMGDPCTLIVHFTAEAIDD